MAKKRASKSGSKKKSPRSKRNAAIRALKAGGNKATKTNINNYLRANAKKGTSRKKGKKGKKRGPTKFQRFLLNSPEAAKKKMGW